MVKDSLEPAPSGGPVSISSSARLTAEQAAQLLNKKARTLWRWRKQGYGPPYYKIGRDVEYLASDIAAWYEAQKQEPQEPTIAKKNAALPPKIHWPKLPPNSRFLGKPKVRARDEEAKRRAASGDSS